MTRERAEPAAGVPTSVHLARLLDEAHDPEVAVGWLIDRLGERSFGLTLLLMAVLALLPGASTVVGVLLAWPAIQMTLGHDRARLPAAVARRRIAVARLARLVSVIAPRLGRVERLIRPRWPAALRAARRPTGAVLLLLGVSLAAPVPFGQIVPALVIMLLALAHLEGDGAALLLGLLAALVSLAATGGAVWSVVQTIDWIDPATPGGY